MKLIDADRLPVKTNHHMQYVLYTAIEDAPAIDPADLMPQAEWEERPVNVGTPTTDFFCTKCGWPAYGRKTKHCPGCGANMYKK